MIPLVLVFMGCTPPCEGAGCGALYPATDLNLLLATSLGEATASPLAADGVVHGALADGNGWALATDGDGVLAGIPAIGEVRRYGPGGFTAGDAAEATYVGEGATDRFGAAVARTPTGLIVGAPGRTTGAGAVFVFAGGDSPERVVEGVGPQQQLGATVASCGDLDGDGATDWVAGAPGSEVGASLGGEVWIVTGSGITTRAGTEAAARFGGSLWCASSLDGDNLAELVVGSPFGAAGGTGAVRVWRGGSEFADADPTLVLSGPERDAWFGTATTSGDLDGDGLPELLVGAPGRDGDSPDTAGAVYVFRGTDLAERLNVPEFLSGTLVPTWELRGVYPRGRMGETVAIADLDGDGFGDVLVGAPGMNPSGADDAVQSGAAYLFRGPPDLWPALRFAGDADLLVSAPRQYLRTGEGMATPDIDGDGLPDLVVINRAADPDNAP